MVVLTKDENVARADAALEVAIASVIAGDNTLDRVAALRLLVQRLVKKNTGNRTRIRTAQTT